MDDPAPNPKPAPEVAGGWAGAGVDDVAPPPNANADPPEAGGAWEADAPNPNDAAGVILAPSAGLDAAGVPPKENAGWPVGAPPAPFIFTVGAGAGAWKEGAPNNGAAAAGVGALSAGFAGVVPPPKANRDPAGAGVAPFPAGMDSDGVPLPKENMGFLLDGSEAPSFFSVAGVVVAVLPLGGAPNANPGMDAPPPLFSVAPNENAPVLAVALLTGSSFFSSLDVAPAPKLNPADDDALVLDAGAADAPKLKPPPDGAATWLASSSRPRFDLAGVLAGVAVLPPNENPPPLDEDGAAPPRLKPPAPMLTLPSPPVALASSRPRFSFAGVAVAPPPNENPPLLMPPPLDEDGAADDDVAPPKLKPPAPMTALVSPPPLAGAAADGVPPKENPPAPMLTFSPLPAPELPLAAALSLAPPAPALGASHDTHFVLASGGFFVMHVSHFHSPGLDLKILPHPPAAGAGAAAAAGAATLGEDFNAAPGDFVLLAADSGLLPNLYAIGVSTLDEAAAPPGMKLYGAAPARTASAFFSKAGVDMAEAAAALLG